MKTFWVSRDKECSVKGCTSGSKLQFWKSRPKIYDGFHYYSPNEDHVWTRWEVDAAFMGFNINLGECRQFSSIKMDSTPSGDTPLNPAEPHSPKISGYKWIIMDAADDGQYRGSEKEGGEEMTFEKWFVEQHGPRPSEKSIDKLMDDMIRASHIYDMAKNLYHECARWDLRQTSARYAWNIEDKDKT